MSGDGWKLRSLITVGSIGNNGDRYEEDSVILVARLGDRIRISREGGKGRKSPGVTGVGEQGE